MEQMLLVPQRQTDKVTNRGVWESSKVQHWLTVIILTIHSLIITRKGLIFTLLNTNWLRGRYYLRHRWMENLLNLFASFVDENRFFPRVGRDCGREIMMMVWWYWWLWWWRCWCHDMMMMSQKRQWRGERDKNKGTLLCYISASYIVAT